MAIPENHAAIIDKENTAATEMSENSQEPERVLLLGMSHHKTAGELDPAASLIEMEGLTETAGGAIVDKVMVNRDKPHPAHYFGKGKIEEISEIAIEGSIDLVIIDDELTVRQQNQLEEKLPCRVIDRTALILQIFADHAKTREGKLQIELAQLSYMLPRLSGKGRTLSRLGGGIGTRGPGESQLEKDRRHIRRRIGALKEEIENIRKQRTVNRERRQRNRMPVIALVGYTNAGKSTLLNLLTDAGVDAEDKLFATLDPVTRRFRLEETEVLLTDTVGFIQQLPHSLVTAFRATMEEALHADLLIHVVDSAHEEMEGQIKTVLGVLEEIGCQDKPMIHVFNKVDMLADPLVIQHDLSAYQPAAAISAKTGEGMVRLRQLMAESLPEPMVARRFTLGVDEGKILNHFYQIGSVSQVNYDAEGITGRIILPSSAAAQYAKYLQK
ncbi:MAG: GTPase HflX [Clostridiales bacterium]|nr:GTPase HflX [Clostridiales bacterium]